jgi:3-hydroxybutyryl-CoA dehydrogenase
MMQAEDIKQVALLGAGMIGSGLALHFSRAGYQVSLYSRTQQTLDRAVESTTSNLAMLLERAADAEEIAGIISRIRITTDMQKAVEGAQIVIESIAEDLEMKQNVFKKIDGICPRDTILATNTSVMSITRIAVKSKNRDRIVGTHFWFPAYLIPLVEVVKGRDTSDEVVDQTYRFMKKSGKHPIKCMKDVPGFVANRLQHALWREAISLVENGIADAATVDEAVKNSFGIRLASLGPLENADLAGLDLTLAVHKTVLKDLEASPHPSPLLRKKVRRGELGVKSGRGFYDRWTQADVQRVTDNLLKYLIDFSHNKVK